MLKKIILSLFVTMVVFSMTVPSEADVVTTTNKVYGENCGSVTEDGITEICCDNLTHPELVCYETTTTIETDNCPEEGFSQGIYIWDSNQLTGTGYTNINFISCSGGGVSSTRFEVTEYTVEYTNYNDWYNSLGN